MQLKILDPIDVMPARSWGRPHKPVEGKYETLARKLREAPTKVRPVRCRSVAEVKAVRVALNKFPSRFGIRVASVCPGGKSGRVIYLQIREVLETIAA